MEECQIAIEVPDEGNNYHIGFTDANKNYYSAASSSEMITAMAAIAQKTAFRFRFDGNCFINTQ